MDPLIALYAAWAQIQWVFTTWIPSWWEALHADYEYIRNIGD